MPVSKSDPAFYVGRESFKMRVVETPATAPDPAAMIRTPPPNQPPPRPLAYPQPAMTPHARRVTSEVVGGITMSKSTLAGFCLTAFALGILATVVIYRILPPRIYEEPAATRLEPLPAPPPPKTFVPEIRQLPTTPRR